MPLYLKNIRAYKCPCTEIACPVISDLKQMPATETDGHRVDGPVEHPL